MFAKIFFKEWKDNFVLFVISILFMAALVFLNLSAQKEMTLYFMGMFLLLFLPITGLILGSGGFYSEFKDNAWVYLFSRPIRKEKIWIFKFISIFTILGAIVAIFFFVKQLLPGLNEVIAEFKVPQEIGSLVSFSTYLTLPILVFAISFSLSILYEKQFAILLISALAGAALALVLQQFHIFLWSAYLYDGKLTGFQILLALSFIVASILTLRRVDFSQTSKKVLYFSKYLVCCLGLSFALTTVWVAKGYLFSGKKWIVPNFVMEHKGDAYLWAFAGGNLLRYSSGSDKFEKVGGSREFVEPGFSVADGKIAFLSISEKKNAQTAILSVISIDGSEKKAPIKSQELGALFNKLALWGNCLLSPDGKKVAFVTVPKGSHPRNLEADSPVIWWMNTDGAGMNSQAANCTKAKSFDLLAWPGSKDILIIGINAKGSDYEIVEFDLANGTQRVLADDVCIGSDRIRVSPDQCSMALCCVHGTKNNATIIMLNLRTQEKNIVYKTDPVSLRAIRWSKEGDKFAFSIKNEVFIYSAKENEIIKTIPLFYPYDRNGAHFDWLQNDQEFILDDVIKDKFYLRTFDKELNEGQRISFPNSIGGAEYLWGLENSALVYDGEKFRLWRVDLTTQKWKKVY
jgi:hypothetical protein